MKYQVRLDILLADVKDAETLLNEVEKIKKKAHKVEEPTLINANSFCDCFKCYHDENPPSPCEVLVNIDFDGDIVTHNDIDG